MTKRVDQKHLWLKLRSALAHATPPAPAVDFDQLRQWLRDAPDAVGDRNRCELLLRAANAEKLSAPEWRALVGGERLQRMREGERLIEGLLKPIKDTLARIADDHIRASAELQSDFYESTSAGVVRTIDGRIIARSTTDAILYSIWLLLSRPELRACLCRCRYRDCGRFFFQPAKRGPPQRTYCSKEHYRAEDTYKARERSQLNRDRKK